MSEIKFTFSDIHVARAVLGEHDRNIALIEEATGAEILARGLQLTFRGRAASCQHARSAVDQLRALVEEGYPLQSNDVVAALRILKQNPAESLKAVFGGTDRPASLPPSVTPKTLMQKAYLEAIRTHDIVFGWGPAGTGKTFLAMAMAVAGLVEKRVDRIILARPAVEAGEKLGFLPGDLAEKVNPYLRPLYDALHDLMDLEKARRLLDTGVIEVAPLAFMRGRTLNRSFVILDEAQNTTSEQMKMFLTRLGFDSKAIITGDITQVDLPSGRLSGLVEALDLLKGVEGIGRIEFTDRDVVRHPLVQKIISAYEGAERA